MKKTDQMYTVTAVIKLDTSVEIHANSLEEALQKSKELSSKQFIKYIGECNDENFKIIGVYRYEPIH